MLTIPETGYLKGAVLAGGVSASAARADSRRIDTDRAHHMTFVSDCSLPTATLHLQSHLVIAPTSRASRAEAAC